MDGQGPVQFLAIADLGYCETDSSLEWESDYPNPITYTPPGTLAALQVEVSLTDFCLRSIQAVCLFPGPKLVNEACCFESPEGLLFGHQIRLHVSFDM